MMMKDLPQQPDPESLSQLDKEELVVVVIEQQKIISQLRQEIERLKVSRDLDSQTSSKPPSGDLLKKRLCCLNFLRTEQSLQSARVMQQRGKAWGRGAALYNTDN